MGSQQRLTQASVFGFLSGTGLPIVSRLASAVRAVAFGLAVGSLGYGLFSLLWWPDSFWTPTLPWSGALPSLASAPLYFLAWRHASGKRMQRAAQFLFAALFVLSILATWQRGAFCPAWYMQPCLALLATCSIGVISGLTMTLLVVVALLVSTMLLPASEALADIWAHTLSLSALTLASALTGAVLHKLLLLALSAAESHRREMHESRRALRYRERLLRHALRVETVGELAGLVSHQLRNTYQVMLGHITLSETASEAERNERLEEIGRLLQDSRPLLDELMGLAHPEEGEPTAVDLEVLVRGFHRRASCLMPASVHVEFAGCGRALPVMLNERGFEHALWNLVINARHAIEKDGTIRIATQFADDDVVLVVSDDGCGMSDTVKRRIFDPYFTTKPRGQGTGLGLVAVDRFVRSSNGRIEVESAPGQGTTFRLRFPVQGDVRQRPAASA